MFERYRSRRAFRKGHAAWLLGDLEGAKERVESALRAEPKSPGILCHLARVLSELERKDDALVALDAAMKIEPGNPTVRVFRAIVHYDSGSFSSVRDELESVKEENLLAQALEALLRLKDDLAARRAGRAPTGPLSVSMPLAARWIADVAGRLLALLEWHFHGRSPAEAIEWHRSLLAPDAAAGPPAKLDAVEAAFAAGRHEEVDRLCAPAGGRDAVDPDPSSGLFHAVSLMALGKEAQAKKLLSKLLQGDPASWDLHFLTGVCRARSTELGRAGWAFARAARIKDAYVDQVIGDLVKLLDIQIDFRDT